MALGNESKPSNKLRVQVSTYYGTASIDSLSTFRTFVRPSQEQFVQFDIDKIASNSSWNGNGAVWIWVTNTQYNPLYVHVRANDGSNYYAQVNNGKGQATVINTYGSVYPAYIELTITR